MMAMQGAFSYYYYHVEYDAANVDCCATGKNVFNTKRGGGMTRLWLSLAQVAIAAVILTACGKSVDSDARKLADLQCKSLKLAKKAMTGDVSILTESNALLAEIAVLNAELDGRYKTREEAAEFLKAYLEAMKSCK